MKRGLLFAEGEEWQRMRTALNPIFFQKGSSCPRNNLRNSLVKSICCNFLCVLFHPGSFSPHYKAATDNLIGLLRDQEAKSDEGRGGGGGETAVTDREGKIHGWSVESTLRKDFFLHLFRDFLNICTGRLPIFFNFIQGSFWYSLRRRVLLLVVLGPGPLRQERQGHLQGVRETINLKNLWTVPVFLSPCRSPPSCSS